MVEQWLMVPIKNNYDGIYSSDKVAQNKKNNELKKEYPWIKTAQKIVVPVNLVSNCNV